MTYENALAQLLKEIDTADRRQTLSTLQLGRLATLAIRARLHQVEPANRSVERARTLADLRKEIETRKPTHTQQLNRWVKVYGTAEAFGIETAKQLPLNTLRAFAPLVQRNTRKESWTVKAKHRDWAAQLWTNAAQTTATAIDAEIRQRLGKPTITKTPPLKLAQPQTATVQAPVTINWTLESMIAAIKKLPYADLTRLQHAIDDAKAGTLMAEKTTPTTRDKLSAYLGLGNRHAG